MRDGRGVVSLDGFASIGVDAARRARKAVGLGLEQRGEMTHERPASAEQEQPKGVKLRKGEPDARAEAHLRLDGKHRVVESWLPDAVAVLLSSELGVLDGVARGGDRDDAHLVRLALEPEEEDDGGEHDDGENDGIHAETPSPCRRQRRETTGVSTRAGEPGRPVAEKVDAQPSPVLRLLTMYDVYHGVTM